jgi:hypothetical protein
MQYFINFQIQSVIALSYIQRTYPKFIVIKRYFCNSRGNSGIPSQFLNSMIFENAKMRFTNSSFINHSTDSHWMDILPSCFVTTIESTQSSRIHSQPETCRRFAVAMQNAKSHRNAFHSDN